MGSIPIRTSLIYFGFACSWILISDTIAWTMSQGEKSELLSDITKGLLFVLVTSYLLFKLLVRQTSKQRETEEFLSLSESKYRQLVEQIPAVVYMAKADENSSTEFASNYIEAVTGFNGEELTTHPDLWIQRIHAEDRERVLGATQETFQNGIDFHEEYRFQAKDGSWKWFLDDARVVRGHEGEIVGLQGVMTDITSLKEAKAALEKSELRFRKLVHSNVIGMLVIDLEGKIHEANDGFLHLIGLSLEQLREMSWLDLFDNADKVKAENILERVVSFDFIRAEALLCQSQNRSALWIEWHITRSDDQMIYCAAHDVTERVVREREMKLLHHALQCAPYALAITDSKGVIEQVNPAFETLTGYSPQEAIGLKPSVLKSGKHKDSFYRSMWNQITQGKSWTGELINKRKDGSFYNERMTITPVPQLDGEIVHYIAIKEDITAEKETQKKALRSQRMENLGLLAGGVAHDLNNILTPIVMAAESVKAELTSESSQEMVKILESSCERAVGVISQLLTFGRGTDGEPVTLQLRHLLKELVQLAKETFPKNITVRMNVPSTLWLIDGDTTQLHQLFMNLIVNARDALSPDGGEIIISGDNVDLEFEDKFLNLEVPPGKYIHLTVHDNGCGMSPETQERLFEPFFTTKEEGKGTGLGLSTAMGVVKSHRGLIRVASQLNEWTRFEIFLPASENESAVFSKDKEVEIDGRGKLVLIVDDEQNILKLISASLNKANFRTMTALRAEDALKAFEGNHNNIFGVITDINMPGLDGIKMLAELKNKKHLSNFIAITGQSDEILKRRSEELNALGAEKDCVLRKPFSRRDLLLKIKELWVFRNT